MLSRSVLDRKFRIKSASRAIPTAIASENGRFAPENWNAREVQSTPASRPAAEGCDLRETGQPALPGTSGRCHRGPPAPSLPGGDAHAEARDSEAAPDRLALQTGSIEPLSSPEAIAATAARSTPMIASQSVAAARVNRPARADAKAGSAAVARERSAGHRHPATAATLCRETDCAAAGRSASPAGLRERRHRSARCRARWRKRSSWRKIRCCRGVPASSELISSITKARVPRSRRRRKAGARQATLSPA
jgi:hypothetical protein